MVTSGHLLPILPGCPLSARLLVRLVRHCSPAGARAATGCSPAGQAVATTSGPGSRPGSRHRKEGQSPVPTPHSEVSLPNPSLPHNSLSRLPFTPNSQPPPPTSAHNQTEYWSHVLETEVGGSNWQARTSADGGFDALETWYDFSCCLILMVDFETLIRKISSL